MDRINEALRLCRWYSLMTATQMAEAVSVTKSHISNIESGYCTPSRIVIERYADFLGVQVSALIKFSESIYFDYAKTSNVWRDKRFWMTENHRSFLIMIESERVR